MTKAEFLRLASSSEPDKALLEFETLERAWTVVEPLLLEVGWLEHQLFEKKTDEEILMSVLQSVGLLIQHRLTREPTQVFWANQGQMKKISRTMEQPDFWKSASPPLPLPHRYRQLACLVVVADEVKSGTAKHGTLLEPERWSPPEMLIGGGDPVYLIMLSPEDLVRMRAGELEVPESFGVHWDLIYP